MVLNAGYIQASQTDDQGREVLIRIYYNANATPVGATQPLANGPRGWCLDLTNTSGKVADITLTDKAGNPQTIRVGQGDPVTTGPAAGRSRTSAQMAALGFTTRGDVEGLLISAAAARAAAIK